MLAPSSGRYEDLSLSRGLVTAMPATSSHVLVLLLLYIGLHSGKLGGQGTFISKERDFFDIRDDKTHCTLALVLESKCMATNTQAHTGSQDRICRHQ